MTKINGKKHKLINIGHYINNRGCDVYLLQNNHEMIRNTLHLKHIYTLKLSILKKLGI